MITNGRGSLSSKKSFHSFRQQVSNMMDMNNSDEEDQEPPSLNVDGVDLNRFSKQYYNGDQHYLNMMNDEQLNPRKGSNSSVEEASELLVNSTKTMSRQSTLNKLTKSVLPNITVSMASSSTATNAATVPLNEEEELQIQQIVDMDRTSDDLSHEDEEEFDNMITSRRSLEKLNMNPGVSSSTPVVSLTPNLTPQSTISQNQNQSPPTYTTPPLNQQQSQSQMPSHQIQQQQATVNTANMINNNYINIRGNLLDKSMPINFNVGGTLFATSLRTISTYPQSLLFKVVELQIDLVLKDEVIFIDRNPIYFPSILDFMRSGKYCAPIKSTSSSINQKGLIMESEFFKLPQMAEQIKNEPELSRVEIIKIINASYDYPRLRGLYLCKTNFHGLDLNCATFEYSNLSECTFQSTLLTNVNFFNAKLDRVLFKNSKASNSTFSNCEITNSQFTNNVCLEIASVNSNFSNSNLANSIFSCSNFTGSNFRNTKLHGCDFTNCNLSHCDFTNASIDGNTNFSGSIMKNCVFEGVDLSVAKVLKTWKKPKTIRNRNKINIPHI
ncbi:BTB/POZ domain-containing protein [Tieghemostelium lacteum]|uniref:BTB/POZ domain-containing protein n=1 Tax=Tieghemostelium lacteum TaxID=361077 RepID=A0A151Z9M8_TIELA|nr:BTB/POZ domain-containing protein [Tieghemostelium lacteum]|eukprot:KYQ90646.1 BTB/POZ domain-containing protein [Tieghemostelium lacteum]